LQNYNSIAIACLSASLWLMAVNAVCVLKVNGSMLSSEPGGVNIQDKGLAVGVVSTVILADGVRKRKPNKTGLDVCFT
jgi:hypothetical protein